MNQTINQSVNDSSFMLTDNQPLPTTLFGQPQQILSDEQEEGPKTNRKEGSHNLNQLMNDISPISHAIDPSAYQNTSFRMDSALKTDRKEPINMSDIEILQGTLGQKFLQLPDPNNESIEILDSQLPNKLFDQQIKNTEKILS